MKYFKLLVIVAFAASYTAVLAQADFGTSLHKTRAGKSYFYSAQNGGFEKFTGIPIDSLGCKGCHAATDADGNAYTGDYTPGCVDCHPTADFNNVGESSCYGCHGRQNTVANQLKLPDVHRDAGLKCWDCHSKEDIHGDGTSYNSLLDDGAIDAKCENCHIDQNSTPPMPDHSSFDPHNGKLDCSACHVQTVIACYNCHFESMEESHLKRAYRPINGFVLLMNRESDGKVVTAGFQSAEYKDTAFVAFAPVHAHTVTAAGRTCADCHNNATVQEYTTSGKIKFTEWNSADSVLNWKKGVVPIPYDYEDSFKMDFITYNGNTSDPVVPSNNWSSIGKDTWDGHQMLFGTPLDSIQMALLSKDFGTAWNNFPTSIHATRNGKNAWYGTAAKGFETLTNIPIDQLGCVECHGPKNAKGEDNGADYEPSCDDCHGVDGTVSESQCLTCHGRQGKERAMGLTDVHRDAATPFVCWDCHTKEDMHGNGTEHQSMLEPGAINVDCEDCHDGTKAPYPDHSSYNPSSHNDKIHCTSCHASTVISCYNCHFESQVDNHIKRANTVLKNFVMLVNRNKDGKVYPATFQSVSYQGNTWAAIGPFTSHTIMKTGRTCANCHNNMGDQNAAIKEYNSTGEIKFTTWDAADSTIKYLNGVIPMPEDFGDKFKMDFITYNGATSDPAVPSKNWSYVETGWDGHQMLYATPLTKSQMAKLGFDTTLTHVDSRLTGEFPTEYQLMQNYPNPFNPATTIKYSLPASVKVRLAVYDILGNEVSVLVDGKKGAGVYEVDFNASELSSGVYFYKLSTPQFEQTRKLILLK